jgi:protein-disulfide isomerase
MSVVLDRPRLAEPVNERDHRLGPATAAVTLVEYGDYECPYCGAAYPVTKELRRMLGDDLQFVYRHFPLSQIHPRAYTAALAAEAAGAQGRFWEMHELLYANQQRLDPESFLLYAQALDLDLERFARDLDERTYEPKVRSDFLGGVRSGVNGTPTFFINGVRHNGNWDLPSLLEAIREAV